MYSDIVHARNSKEGHKSVSLCLLSLFSFVSVVLAGWVFPQEGRNGQLSNLKMKRSIPSQYLQQNQRVVSHWPGLDHMLSCDTIIVALIGQA